MGRCGPVLTVTKYPASEIAVRLCTARILVYMLCTLRGGGLVKKWAAARQAVAFRMRGL